MELGRAFIIGIPVRNHAHDASVQGLFHVMLRNESYRYFIGPVSISSWVPKLYQSLMYKYIMENHSTDKYPDMVHPRIPFTPEYGLVDPDVLLRDITTPEQLDRLLMRMSNRQYRLPSLVKRYLKLNTKVLVFNIDKDFNDSLDGFIVCDVYDVSKEELKTVTKDITDPSIIENVLENLLFDNQDTLFMQKHWIRHEQLCKRRSSVGAVITYHGQISPRPQPDRNTERSHGACRNASITALAIL